MTDVQSFSNIIDEEFGVPKRNALAGAIGFIDDDPEKARRSLELSEATGVPATSIIGDVEGFERQHKAGLASELVRNNAYISDYLAAQPMASRLSNDDYGNLDAVSQAVSKMQIKESIIGAAVLGFKEGFGDQGVGSWALGSTKEDLEFFKKNRLAMSALTAITSPVELTLRSLSGMVKAATDAAQPAGAAIYRQFGGSENEARRFGKDMAGMVEMLTNQPLLGVTGGPITPEVVMKARQTLQAAKPWLDAGLEPPMGIHPELDKLKIKQSDLELSNLDDAFKEAQKSATRERSPELFAEFLRQHGDAKIGVSGDAIAKLYADKPPTPDDALLGWVPRIAEQIETAVATGGDIEIPLADWLARVDPDIAKQLHDDIRVRPGGVTKNEVKALAQVEEIEKQPASLSLTPAELKFFEEVIKPQYGLADEVPSVKLEGNRLTWDVEHSGPLLNWIDEARIERNKGERLPPSFYKGDLHKRMQDIPDEFKIEPLAGPVHNVRVQAALKPLWERKLTLEREGLPEEQASRASKGEHRFVITDPETNVVATLEISEERGGKRLYVDNIEGVEGFGPNDLGPSNIRSVLRQLKVEFPTAKELMGKRVSGARFDPTDVTIKLDQTETWEIDKLTDEWQRMTRAPLGGGVDIVYKPAEAYTAHEALIVEKVQEVLARIVPDVATTVVQRVELKGREVGGAYISGAKIEPIIAVSLDSRDAGKTARHEAIHHLREYGFFTDAEWAALIDSADRGGWLKKHNIEERYKKHAKMDREALLEEAIAEEFGQWGSQTEAPRRHYNEAVNKAFTKLAAFFKEVLDAMKEIFGHTPKIDELFEKIESGEVGRRTVEDQAKGEVAKTKDPSEVKLADGNDIINFGERKEKKEVEGFRKELVAGVEKRAVDRYKQAQQLHEDGKLPFDRGTKFTTEHSVRNKMLPWEVIGYYVDGKDRYGYYVERGTEGQEGWERATLITFDPLDGRKAELAKEFKPFTGLTVVKGQEPELPGTTRMEDRAPFTGPFPGWMTQAQRAKYLKLIDERELADAARIEKKEIERLERERTAEWKSNKESVRGEVESNLESRPDIAADRLLGNGVLYGEKISEKPKLGREWLTPEQIKALPPDYIADTGIHPDDLAGLFGYKSGKDLVDRLAELTSARTTAGMTPRAYLSRIVDLETERVMNERYGETSAEALQDARDYALSEAQQELLHEQTLTLALGAKLEFSLTKDQLREAVRNAFARTPLENVDSNRGMNEAGRAGRAMEDAFLKGDTAEAFRQSQRQYLSSLFAKEAVKLEKEQARFEKVAKRFQPRNVKNIEQSATNEIRELLLKAGLINEVQARDIADLRANGEFQTLNQYIESKAGDKWEPDVAGWMVEGNVPPFEQMSTAQFCEFRDAIKSIEHIGRQEKKIDIAGIKQDYAEWRKGVIDNITELPPRAKEKQMKLLFRFDAELTRMEEIVKDLDLRRELGPLYRALIEPMMSAKHTEYKKQEQLARTLETIRKEGKAWKKTLGDEIPNDFFIDPDNGIPFNLNRSDMINIMLNWGNRSNIEKFTKGWAKLVGQDAAELELRLNDLIQRHATKEDWGFVQKIGNVFEGWKEDIRILYTNVSGLPPKWVNSTPVDTAHGQYAGWYFPVIYDKHYSHRNVLEEAKRVNSVFEKDYFSALTGNGHTKERTGYIDAVEFRQSVDQLGTRMQQVIHDISYRAAVMQAQKVVKDKGIRSAIRKHYGMEYEAQLEPWLQDIANHFNQNEKANSFTNEVLRRARFNVVAHALGLNLKVILSPDVGMLNPRAAMRVLGNLEADTALANAKSKEIPHTYKNMDRDFRESLERIIEDNKWNNFQSTAVRWAFTPIVKVSQGFRIITFVDEYKKALARGLNDVDAAEVADIAVRQRHGATGIPDLPAIMRANEAMKMATMFYGYFNAMYNWQRQSVGQVKRGEWMNAMGTIYGAVLIPAAFGAVLFNKAEKDESWFKTTGKAVGLQLTGTLPFAREFASYMAEGYSARTPMTSVIQAMGSTWKDIEKATQGKKVDKPVQHTANVIGLTAGLPLGQIGKTSEFLTDVAGNRQRPKDFFDWYRGIVHGEMKPKR